MENKTHTVLEACLDKELVNGKADCDDPSFQVRTIKPDGLKMVIYIDEERSDLHFVPNNVLFGWPEPDDGAENFIDRHLTPEGLPLTGLLEGTGETQIVIEHPDAQKQSRPQDNDCAHCYTTLGFR
ncbi:hypothetical protein KJ673_03200 [Patescibacteria group bacterium]|nr:hypothetical protein [Patescibacteria group bacterium]MCG2687832.1 hypothetical protein [Candidatus Parcubacteria bacterium]